MRRIALIAAATLTILPSVSFTQRSFAQQEPPAVEGKPPASTVGVAPATTAPTPPNREIVPEQGGPLHPGAQTGLDVVAEGVEDEQTWEALKRMGCSAAQGYFIGRPMPAGELEGWLRNWSQRSAGSKAA